MLINRASDIASAEITPRSVYEQRRHFMKLAGALLGATGLFGCGESAREQTLGLQRLENVGKSAFSTGERLTAYEHVTSYNNYYEFGTDKEQPALLARRLKVRPWTVVIEGEVARPRTLGIEEILGFPLEERIYRL